MGRQDKAQNADRPARGGQVSLRFFGPGAVAAGSIADGGRVGYFRASLTASLGTISSLKT